MGRDGWAVVVNYAGNAEAAKAVAAAIERTGGRASRRPPARSARAITGTKPECDTRFGSSNIAGVFVRLYNNRTYKVPFLT